MAAGNGKGAGSKPPASFLLHPNGCRIEFRPLGDDLMKVISRHPDRPAIEFGKSVDASLARHWWKGWVRQGFEPETKGN